MELKTIGDIEVGDKASLTKTISESDVYLFAGITGDLNPAHTDAEYMKTTPFRQRVAHGVLTMGLMSAVIGMKLPGPGTILLSTSARFTAPVFFNDTITAEVEVAEKNVEKNRLKLNVVCTNQDGKTVITGEFIVSPYVKK